MEVTVRGKDYCLKPSFYEDIEFFDNYIMDDFGNIKNRLVTPTDTTCAVYSEGRKDLHVKVNGNKATVYTFCRKYEYTIKLCTCNIEVSHIFRKCSGLICYASICSQCMQIIIQFPYESQKIIKLPMDSLDNNMAKINIVNDIVVVYFSKYNMMYTIMPNMEVYFQPNVIGCRGCFYLSLTNRGMPIVELRTRNSTTLYVYRIRYTTGFKLKIGNK